MSHSLLPTIESPPPNFLLQLLEEQSQLTAVERFAAAHERATQATPAAADHQPAQARYYQSLLPASAPGPDQQYAFEVDLDSCSGCKACVVACHTLNGLDEEESWRRVGAMTIGQTEPQLKHVTTACHHCVEPACLAGCPVKAYHKDASTGIVRHLDDQCIGCKYCTMMCPYEVPTYSSRLGIVRKCDMCHQRLSVGEAPACVQSCPNEAIAIRIVSVDSPPAGSEERLSAGAPPSSITRPATQYIGLSQASLDDARPQDAELDHPAESHWPLALMLVATQVSVGLLLVERLLPLAVGQGELPQLASRFSAATTTTALLIALVGLAIAGLHLGQPLRAWRVMLGIRTSWLSREAAIFGPYVGLLGTAVALRSLPWLGIPAVASWVHTLPTWTDELCLWLALPLGLAGAYCSGMIYIATQRPLWNGPRTFIRFGGSGLLGGLLGCGTLLSCIGGMNNLAAGLLFTGALLSAAKLGWEWRVQLGPELSVDSPHSRRSRRLLRQQLIGLRTLRLTFGLWSLWMAGLAICFAFLSDATVVSAAVASLALTFVLAGEVCERLTFFTSVVFDRMPGTIR